MKSLFALASSFRQRAVALFHRTDRVSADAAERRERWNQLISEHQKPLDEPKGSGHTKLPQA